MSSPNIPRDILAEILIRLPIDSIIRFRCVSKAWYSLIYSASFISTQTHFATGLAGKTNLLLLGGFYPYDWENCSFSLRSDVESVGEYRNLGIPLKGFNVRVNNSCHGLICLSQSTAYRLNVNTVYWIEKSVIWNPTLGISLALPERKTSHYSSDVVGFGFDGQRNDYKVIRIPNSCSSDRSGRQYDVFELSKNAWKIVTPSIFPHCMHDFRKYQKRKCHITVVFVNGSAHWISGLNKCTIVAFDFIDEVFLELNLPGALKDPYRLWIAVKEMRYLSVIHYEDDDALSAYYNVWVMKEYGVEGLMVQVVHHPRIWNGASPRAYRFQKKR